METGTGNMGCGFVTAANWSPAWTLHKLAVLVQSYLDPVIEPSEAVDSFPNAEAALQCISNRCVGVDRAAREFFMK